MKVLQSQLADPALDAELNLKGFVTIKKLFTDIEVKQMLDLYNENHVDRADREKTLWNSLFDLTTERGVELSKILISIIQPRLNSVMLNFKAPVASFMSKNYGGFSECTLHRDTSVFDENRFEYFNIWIPLVDVGKKNGSVYFLKGSHNFFNYPRPPALSWQYQHLTSPLMSQVETVEAQAGDCVIYLGKVLHGSHLNLTDKFRPVVFLGAIHPEAELLYYFYDEKIKQVRAYAVPENFYFGKDFSEPLGKYPQRLVFDYNPPDINIAEVEDKLKQFA
jgi:hypothetical protein